MSMRVLATSLLGRSLRTSSLLAPASRAAYSTDTGKEAPKEAKEAKETKEKKDSKEATVEDKEKQLAELKNNYLRCLADMENLRQRTKKEVQQAKDFAVQKFAKDLLDTADILNMALKAVDETTRAETANAHLNNLFEGVDMTRRELMKTLARHGVERIEALDKPFDANMHHAMFETPIPGKAAGTVFVVEKEGFLIKGRILRPSQVGVVRDA